MIVTVCTLQIFDLDTLSVHYKFQAPSDEAAACSAIRFVSDGNMATKNVVLAAQGERVTQYHATSGTVMASMQEEGNNIYALDVRKDGEVFVTGGSDHSVRVTDRNARKLVSTFGNKNASGTQGHTNRIYSVAYCDQDPQIVASGGWDKVVCIWDLRLRSGRCATTLFGPFVCGDALSFCDNVLATGSWRNDNPLQIWDWRRPGLLRNLPFPQEINNSCLVYAAKMLDSDCLGAGGSGSAPCFRFYTTEGRMMGSWPAPSAVHSIATATKGAHRKAVVCCEAHIAIFSVPSPQSS
ncbi:hypothetical protein BSKO_04930 [Bryopsis sp. KO-2023]|nr:hypothetical protein BSKO_04930 [Bryopsis sp. KO-2023]